MSRSTIMLNPAKKHRITSQQSPLGTNRQPTFSIVIPSYNQAKYIESAIESVIQQNYPKTQLIVIDGNSTDGSKGIIRRYDKYISHYISEADKGQSDALNKGFALATGDIYGWLNSDDVYMPEAFTTGAELFRKKAETAVVFGDWLEIDQNGQILRLQHAFDFNLGHLIYEGFHLNTQSMFWTSAAHNKFGNFDISLHRTMDYQLLIGLAAAMGENAFTRTPAVLGCFRRHSEQKTQPGQPTLILREHKRIASRYGFEDKYTAKGKILRTCYRLRRFKWRLKREGVAAIPRIMADYHNKLLQSGQG